VVCATPDEALSKIEAAGRSVREGPGAVNLRYNRRTSRETIVAKLGDVKGCRICPAETVLTRIPQSDSGFGGVDGGALSRYIPAYYAWKCGECDDREPFDDDEIET
jgi:hypothetical protein